VDGDEKGRVVRRGLVVGQGNARAKLPRRAKVRELATPEMPRLLGKQGPLAGWELAPETRRGTG